jgi:hypothetical protein
MSEVQSHERTTLQMIEEYVVSSQKLFDLLHLKRKRFSPRSWLRERKKRELEGRTTKLDATLAKCYGGLLVQIFERSGVSAGDYEEKTDAILEVLRDKVLQLQDYRYYPESFWRACAVETAGVNHLAPLKHKFMIRPFVDEITSPLERDALLTRAYRSNGRRPADDEFEAVIDNACTLLHQVMQGAEHVSILTGGVFTPELLGAITSPLEQYTEWLFRA